MMITNTILSYLVICGGLSIIVLTTKFLEWFNKVLS